MGTRCLTYIFGDKTPLLCFYRQYDGYPQGHGVELGKFISSIKVVNGYQHDMTAGEYANGPGCFAAQVLSHFKNEAGLGGIYVQPPVLNADSGQEYEYHIHFNSVYAQDRWVDNKYVSHIEVYSDYIKDRLLFSGNFSDFLIWAKNPAVDEDDNYIPVIKSHIVTVTLQDILPQKIVKVDFLKADGSPRTMRCTLNPAYIPEDMLNEDDSVPVQKDPNLYKVWDLDKNEWRSFRKERILSFETE